VGRVELRRDLEAVVARLIRDRVGDITEQVAEQARRRAPDARVWVSRDDERVRPAHVDANGQMIPANLRFRLREQIYIRGGGRGSDISGHTVLGPRYLLARVPRDESLPPDQKINCRCEAVTVPGVIARRIRVSGPAVEGGRVTGRVSVEFQRIVESEYGTSGDTPAAFMRGALAAVTARLRARR